MRGKRKSGRHEVGVNKFAMPGLCPHCGEFKARVVNDPYLGPICVGKDSCRNKKNKEYRRRWR